MLDLLDGDAGKLADLERRVAAHLGFAGALDQRRPGLPALARLRRGERARPAGRRAVVAGHDDPADGGRRAGHRGVPAGPGRVVGDAAQDELAGPRSGSTGCWCCCAATPGWPPSSPVRSGTRATCPTRWCAASRCPDAFFALDGLYETALTVLDEFGAYPAVIARELDRYLPFLATTAVLMAAVRAGVGRETAHEVIKEHAVGVALAMREKGQADNDLVARLAGDERLGLPAGALDGLLADPLRFTGAASAQVAAVRRARTGGRRHATRTPPPTPPERSCEAAALGQGPRALPRRRRPDHWSRRTGSRSTTWCSRPRSRTRARCSPSCRCGGSTGSPTSCRTT